jgi:hypothetical protein
VHILVLIVIGLLVLAAFVLVGRLISRGEHKVNGTRPFIRVWLIGSKRAILADRRLPTDALTSIESTDRP